jgi:hypothetical protein
MDNAHANPTSSQEKLKGNAVLWRQVKNMNKKNWYFRKTLRFLRLQVSPEA